VSAPERDTETRWTGTTRVELPDSGLRLRSGNARRIHRHDPDDEAAPACRMAARRPASDFKAITPRRLLPFAFELCRNCFDLEADQ